MQKVADISPTIDQDKYVPSPASRGEDIYVPSATAIFYFPMEVMKYTVFCKIS